MDVQGQCEEQGGGLGEVQGRRNLQVDSHGSGVVLGEKDLVGDAVGRTQ